MPIALSYTTPNTGAPATYHVVQQIMLDFESSITNATVASFVSKDARIAGKFAMYAQQIPLSGLPAAGQDPMSFVEATLIQPMPDGTSVAPYGNRYAFAGGEIVE